MIAARQLLGALAGLVFLLGTTRGGERGPPEPRGLVYVVGGIGGLDPLQLWAPLAFERAGVEHEIRIHEWTHGKLHFFRDLRDLPHMLQRADELAAEIRSVLRHEPGRPIYLVGHSAGAALILLAAGQLPPRSLERIVVLSAAVSPTFDLCPALRASRGGVVAFSSSLDFVFLGMWTCMLGTVDRVYCCGAGMKGFVIPPGIDARGRQQYAGLVQLPWRFEDLFELRGGGHHATTAPLFLSRDVAPWLRKNPCSTRLPLEWTPAPR